MPAIQPKEPGSPVSPADAPVKTADPTWSPHEVWRTRVRAASQAPKSEPRADHEERR